MVKILLADDDPFVLRSLITFLKDNVPATVLVEAVTNGQELIEKVRTNEYAVILTDNQMPIMTGIEAVREIRTFSQTPIYVLSADDVQVESLAAGATGFYSKTKEIINDLREIVRRYITP